MPSMRKLKLGRHWTFRQDNDPKHTSNCTKTWLQKKFWKILLWSSQSPDLSPMQNLLRNGLIFLRKAARSWCLVIHLVIAVITA